MQPIVGQLMITALCVWQVIYAFLLLVGQFPPNRAAGYNYGHLIVNGMIVPFVVVKVVLFVLPLFM